MKDIDRESICSVLRTEQIPRGVPVPPANPPGEERSPGKGNPFPESPTRRRRRFPASKRHRRPGTNPSPILRERFGVSFRFTVHAAEADYNRRELPPIPPHCCHTFVLLHTRLNSYVRCFQRGHDYLRTKNGRWQGGITKKRKNPKKSVDRFLTLFAYGITAESCYTCIGLRPDARTARRG